MSDISQVFEMGDILVLSEAITALSGGDLKKKMGILSSAPSSVFLSLVYTFRAPDFVMITIRIVKNVGI
jgi:hypothetical protein